MFIRFAQTSKDEKKRCIGFELSFDQSCLDYDGLSLMYFLFSHHFSSIQVPITKKYKKALQHVRRETKRSNRFHRFLFFLSEDIAILRLAVNIIGLN